MSAQKSQTDTIREHLKGKSDEELSKGLEALYESYLRNKTRLQLVKILMDQHRETDWTRDLVISEIVRVQLAMMFGEE